MSPSGTPAPEILVDDKRQKFIDILKSNGITDEVDNLIMSIPQELKGEHMASASAYLRVEFKDVSKKPKNLFVKMFTNNEMHTQMVKQMKVMEKESEFFNEFLPAAKEFCKKYSNCENLIDFFPKCLYGDDETVVLENVVLDDTFVMLPKEEFQDLHTAKFVLTNLAKFHASTHAMIEETGREEFQRKWSEIFMEYFISDKNPFIGQMYDNGINMCLNILKGNPVEGQEETVKKLTAYLGNINGTVVETLPVKPDDKLWVINHGDCWNNNMLFKVDSESGKVVDHIFVDLQVTRLGSPCLDLGYYLFTSVKPAIRRAHLKELLLHYYEEFKRTVELFNRKCPVTLEEFFDEYKDKCKLGYFSNLNFMAAIGAMKDVDLDSEAAAGMMNEEDMTKMFMDVINNWITNNPEKAASISLELVAVLKEYLALTSQ